jgi:hypothetical protein
MMYLIIAFSMNSLSGGVTGSEMCLAPSSLWETTADEETQEENQDEIVETSIESIVYLYGYRGAGVEQPESFTAIWDEMIGRLNKLSSRSIITGNFCAANDAVAYASYTYDNKVFYIKYALAEKEQVDARNPGYFADMEEMLNDLFAQPSIPPVGPLLAYMERIQKEKTTETLRKVRNVLLPYVEPLYMRAYKNRPDKLRSFIDRKNKLLDQELAADPRAIGRIRDVLEWIRLDLMAPDAQLTNTTKAIIQDKFQAVSLHDPLVDYYLLAHKDIQKNFKEALGNSGQGKDPSAPFAQAILSGIDDKMFEFYEATILAKGVATAKKKEALANLIAAHPVHVTTGDLVNSAVFSGDQEFAEAGLGAAVQQYRALGDKRYLDLIRDVFNRGDMAQRCAAAQALAAARDPLFIPEYVLTYPQGRYVSFQFDGKPYFLRQGVGGQAMFTGLQEVLADSIEYDQFNDILPVINLFHAQRVNRLKSIVAELSEIIDQFPFTFKDESYKAPLAAIDPAAPDAEKRIRDTVVGKLHKSIAENMRTGRRDFPAEAVSQKALEDLTRMVRQLTEMSAVQRKIFVNVTFKTDDAKKRYVAQLKKHAAGGQDLAPFAAAMLDAFIERDIEGYRARLAGEGMDLEERKAIVSDVVDRYRESDQAAELLLSKTNVSDFNERCFIIEQLGKLTPRKKMARRVKDVLAGGLTHSDLRLRIAAAASLCALGDQEDFGRLLELLSLKNEDIARLLGEKLTRLLEADLHFKVLSGRRSLVKDFSRKFAPADTAELAILDRLLENINDRIEKMTAGPARLTEQIVEMRTFQNISDYYEFVSDADNMYTVTYDRRGSPEIRIVSQKGIPEPMTDPLRVKMITELLQKGFQGESDTTLGWFAQGDEIKLFADGADLRAAMRGEYDRNELVRYIFDRAVMHERGRKEGRRFVNVDEMLSYVTRDREKVKKTEAPQRVVVQGRSMRAAFAPATETILPVVPRNFAQLYAMAKDDRNAARFAEVLSQQLSETPLADERFVPQDGDVQAVCERFVSVFPEAQRLHMPGFFKEPEIQLLDLFNVFGCMAVGERMDIQRRFVMSDPAFESDKRLAYTRGMLRFLISMMVAKQVVREDIAQTAVSHEFVHFLHFSLMMPELRREWRKYVSRKIKMMPKLKQELQQGGLRDDYVMERKNLIKFRAETEILASVMEWIISGKGDPLFKPGFDDIRLMHTIGFVSPAYTMPLTPAGLKKLEMSDPLRAEVKLRLATAGYATKDFTSDLPVYEVPTYADNRSIINMMLYDIGDDPGRELSAQYKIDPAVFPPVTGPDGTVLIDMPVAAFQIARVDGREGAPLVLFQKEDKVLTESVQKQIAVESDPARKEYLERTGRKQQELLQVVLRTMHTYHFFVSKKDDNKKEQGYFSTIYVIKRPLAQTVVRDMATVKPAEAQEGLYAIVVKKEEYDTVAAAKAILSASLERSQIRPGDPMMVHLIDILTRRLQRVCEGGWNKEKLDDLFIQTYLAKYPDLAALYDGRETDRSRGLRPRPLVLADARMQGDYFLLLYTQYQLYRQMYGKDDTFKKEFEHVRKNRENERMDIRYLQGIIDFLEWDEARFMTAAAREQAMQQKFREIDIREGFKNQLIGAGMPPAAPAAFDPHGAELVDVMP